MAKRQLPRRYVRLEIIPVEDYRKMVENPTEGEEIIPVEKVKTEK